MRLVKLKPRHAKPLWHGHPWVFAKSVAAASRIGDEPHDWVRVEDDEGRLVGHGIWSGSSAIRVRLLTGREEEQPGSATEILSARIRSAAQLRKRLFLERETTNAFRVVHAEADGVPGLVVDQYGDWLVAQWATRPIYDRRETLGKVLLEATGAKGLTSRAAGHEDKEEISTEDGPFQLGDTVPERVVIQEHGLKLLAHPHQGQKTGHYTDQRENRLRVARHAVGRDILDLFCGSGGFSVHALAAGADHAIGVDSAKQSIEMAEANAVQNGVADRFHGTRAAVHDVLGALKAQDRQFQMVICDPPNLIPTREVKAKATKNWRELLVRSLTRVESGGILASFSCTPRLAQADLLDLLRSASRDCRRSFRVLEELGAGADHPWLPHVPNTRYLSGHIVQVLPW